LTSLALGSQASRVSGVEVGQHREHPPVVVVRRRHAELAEDVVDVLADRLLRDEELAAIAAFDRPSAISPSTSRSRAVSTASGSRRASSWETTSGSIAVPPSATRRTASMNWATFEIRSLSR
jgi:hypothetical protein